MLIASKQILFSFQRAFTPQQVLSTKHEAYIQNLVMKSDTIVQVVFGILATFIAVLSIWLAWRSNRGESPYFSLGVTLRSPIFHLLLTPHQPETCYRIVRTISCCPYITTMHRPRPDTSGFNDTTLLCNWDNLDRTAARTCRPHNNLVEFPVLSVGDD